jgi:hypothetical protein
MFGRCYIQWWRLTLCLGISCVLHDGGRAADREAVCHIELTAKVSVRSQAGARVRVWIPVPQSSAFQSVGQMTTREGLPLKLTRGRRYGNEMLYGEGSSRSLGRLDFELAWSIARREVRLGDLQSQDVLSLEAASIWLQGSTKVPVGGRPLGLLNALTLPEEASGKARLFYDRVLEHMQYDKSRPGYGTGDAVWACDSRFGNCTELS